MKTRRIALAACLCLLASAAPAQPDNYPSRPVRLIVGYAPGGSTDVVARTLGAALSRRWGTQVVVENRSGADSIIASEHVARSAPDGHTLLLANSANATHPSMHARLPYDPLTDLAPVAMSAAARNVITTADPAIRTLADALKLARAQPASVSYGSGSPLHHLVGELLAQQSGTRLTHVPYKGAGPATSDTIAGHVKLNIGTVASQEPHIRSGKLRALAIAADSRSPVLPDVPTVAELGIPNVRADYWIGVMGPARLPPAIVARLHADLQAVVREPDVVKRFADLGLEPMAGTPEQMGRMLAAEIERWSRVARQAGIEKQ